MSIQMAKTAAKMCAAAAAVAVSALLLPQTLVCSQVLRLWLASAASGEGAGANACSEKADGTAATPALPATARVLQSSTELRATRTTEFSLRGTQAVAWSLRSPLSGCFSTPTDLVVAAK
eukprot:752496-Pleurochrysis_carterae.AAC.2